MRAAGIQSLRLLLWHMSDVSGQDWGVIPSAGGRLVQPYRSNLINYLSDVRAADFKALTLDFGPEWSNDPVGFPQDVYDPAKFDENWSFIRDVRPLVKRFGPAITRIDLLSEGAPSSYLPASLQRIKDYISEMYRRYVDAFGKSDVTVSAIAPPEPNANISQPEGGHRPLARRAQVLPERGHGLRTPLIGDATPAPGITRARWQTPTKPCSKSRSLRTRQRPGEGQSPPRRPLWLPLRRC
jgi:hypothetical protein